MAHMTFTALQKVLSYTLNPNPLNPKLSTPIGVQKFGVSGVACMVSFSGISSRTSSALQPAFATLALQKCLRDSKAGKPGYRV